MPRKVNYGIDYVADDYHDYEDYDYDFDVEEHGEVPESKQETSRLGIWRCAICTYDNDEDMSACDICGVIRPSMLNSCNSSDKKADDGICKDFGASIMAKSLFASLPHRTPKTTVLYQEQDDDCVTGEGNNFHKHGITQANFHEFHKAFSSQSQYNINIVDGAAPFKFDSPSPDDMVSNGMQSFKMGSNANFANFKTSNVSSDILEKKTAVNVQKGAEKSDNLTESIHKGKHESADNSDTVKKKAGAKISDRLPASMPKGRCNNITKNGDVSIIASDKGSDSSSALLPKEKDGNERDYSSTTLGKPQSLTNRLDNISSNAKSAYSSNVNARGAISQVKFKPEKWMLPPQADDALTQLNLAIVGHVDSGKSTLSGRLLHLLGRISQKEMHKYEKEAKLQGKGSFAYAWALDESAEERERGITMTVAVAYFDSKKYHVVVLDSPGHKDFVPNMISGATQADAAILVIDASLGSFEAGMNSNKGQTREHAQLIRSFGVDQIIVAVNKMDIVEYSKDRFDLIKQQLGTFLHSCGFKHSSVSWIPLSVMENQNLVEPPSDFRLASWYHGHYLLDAIDSLQPPIRDFSKPLLMPICDVIRLPLGQLSACGKLEAGALRSGSKVVVMPTGDVGTVRSLERDSQACSVARAGDNVSVCLQGIDGNSVMAGGVLCHPDFPVAVAKHFELKVLVLDVATPILIGSQLEFHIHHAKEAAHVVRILSLLDPKTGKVTKKAPRCLIAKQSAVVEVVLHEPVCVEEFSSCKALGRVFLRALGRTVAVGVVSRIIEQQD